MDADGSRGFIRNHVPTHSDYINVKQDGLELSLTQSVLALATEAIQ